MVFCLSFAGGKVLLVLFSRLLFVQVRVVVDKTIGVVVLFGFLRSSILDQFLYRLHL